MKVLEQLGKAVAGIALILWFGVHLKTCELHVWSPPDEPVSYSVITVDARTMEVLFTPESEMLIRYSDPAGPFRETALAEVRGIYGTRLFSTLWKLDGPGIWLGYRVYPLGVKPVHMETTIVKKRQSGTRSTSFGTRSTSFLETGERSHEVILFSHDAIEFAGTPLDRNAQVDPSLVSELNTLRDANQ